MENIFDFSKMDKKNVQFPIIKKVLTDEKFYLDKKIYGHNLNETILFLT
jgi:hypothetical protein